MLTRRMRGSPLGDVALDRADLAARAIDVDAEPLSARDGGRLAARRLVDAARAESFTIMRDARAVIGPHVFPPEEVPLQARSPSTAALFGLWLWDAHDHAAGAVDFARVPGRPGARGLRPGRRAPVSV